MDSLPWTQHQEEGNRLLFKGMQIITTVTSQLTLKKSPVEHGFQPAGHGPFVGHKNKSVGHMQHFKELNRIG